MEHFFLNIFEKIGKMTFPDPSPAPQIVKIPDFFWKFLMKSSLIRTVRRLHSRMCSRKPPKTHHTRNIMLEENPSGKYWVFVLINSGILAIESVEKVCQNITMSYRNGERTISSVWDGTLKPFLGIRVRKNKDTIKESFLNVIQIIQWNQYM